MKILVIRRDNIGDLVLTTPVFRALRQRFPEARIDAFVNSYNAAVLAGHPDVDHVHAYTKGKHRAGLSLGWIERLRQMWRLRQERYDHVIIATPGIHPRQIRFARFLNPAHITSFVPVDWKMFGVDQPVEYLGKDRHHLLMTYRILLPFGIEGDPPAPRIAAATPSRSAGDAPRIAVHVSARKPSSRWPEERYVELMRALHERMGARFRLFWAPGAEDDPRHPGDDGKAARILAGAEGVPVEAIATGKLEELIAGIAACDAIVCSDGGAMHLAAAMGKPVLCFFGASEAHLWHPWGVPYRLLQPESCDVADVTVAETLAAFEDLRAEANAAPG